MSERPGLGERELDVLRFVAEHAPVSAREVAEQFSEEEGLARTTVLTLMERLRKKGYLTRVPVEGLYRYSLAQPRSDLLRDLVGDFVETALGGSLSPFMAYLARDARLSEPELEELRRILDEHDARQRESES